jgi:hypothetical protein
MTSSGFGQAVFYCCRPVRGFCKVALKHLKTVDHRAFFVGSGFPKTEYSNLETPLSARERSVKFVVRSDDLLSFSYTYGTI